MKVSEINQEKRHIWGIDVIPSIYICIFFCHITQKNRGGSKNPWTLSGFQFELN